MNEKGAKYCNSCGDDIQPDKHTDEIYADTGICLKCSHKNTQEAPYCQKCGATLIISEEVKKKQKKKKDEIPVDMVITCSGCGHENKGQKFCTKCGTKLSPPDTSK